MIKVNDKTFNAISFYVTNTTMKNVSRETLFITIKDSTYEEINSTLVDGIEIIKIDTDTDNGYISKILCTMCIDKC